MEANLMKPNPENYLTASYLCPFLQVFQVIFRTLLITVFGNYLLALRVGV